MGKLSIVMMDKICSSRLDEAVRELKNGKAAGKDELSAVIIGQHPWINLRAVAYSDTLAPVLERGHFSEDVMQHPEIWSIGQCIPIL